MPNSDINETMKELVNHPEHYGGAENPYEAIKVIEAWKLGFHLGNAVKYINDKMELQTAIEILEYHQAWRLGLRQDMIHDPKKLTEAFDIVLKEVKKKRTSQK